MRSPGDRGLSNRFRYRNATVLIMTEAFVSGYRIAIIPRFSLVDTYTRNKAPTFKYKSRSFTLLYRTSVNSDARKFPFNLANARKLFSFVFFLFLTVITQARTVRAVSQCTSIRLNEAGLLNTLRRMCFNRDGRI